MRAARILAVLLATASCASIPDLEAADAGGDRSEPAYNGLDPSAGSDASTVLPDGAPAADDAAPPPQDAAPPPQDGGPPPQDAAPPHDAGQPPQDASACVLPAGALLCCDGTIPCVGNKCGNDCSLCKDCTNGRICCVAPNGKTATCASDVASCGHGAGNGQN